MPTPTKVQLENGNFQDSEGNVLANGYLTMRLSRDMQIVGVGQICAGIDIKITLDVNGNVTLASNQFVWGNDQGLPVNTYYRVIGYKQNGQIAWGPNTQQVTGSGGTFDLNTWVPNQVISWTPSPQSLQLQTNETNNGSQALLDLHAGTNITLTDNGSGRVTIAGSTSPITLQTNEVDNGSQVLLDLHAGSNVTLTDNGSGRVTIAASASGAIPAPANPFDQDILRYSGSGSAWISDFYLASYWWFQPMSAGTSTGTGNQFAGVFGFGNSTSSPVNLNGTETLPPGWQFPTSGIGSTAGAGINMGGNITTAAAGVPFQFWRKSKFKVQLGQTTNMRIWIGYGQGQVVGNSVWSADAPAAQFIGFRYSTAAGDTKYACVTQTDATHQTATAESTASHVDTGVHDFELRWDGTNVIFFIDGTQVGSQNTNMPSNTQCLTPIIVIDNCNTANSQTFSVYFMGGVGHQL